MLLDSLGGVGEEGGGEWRRRSYSDNGNFFATFFASMQVAALPKLWSVMFLAHCIPADSSTVICLACKEIRDTGTCNTHGIFDVST